LFEVKTDINTQSLYSGVWRLLVNSLQQEEKRPKLILVVPYGLPSKMEEGLKSIGVECLDYSFEKKRVRFNNLERFH